MSEETKPPQKPLNFEQAVNYIEEQKENHKTIAKKDAEQAPISVIPEADQRKYLMYGISLLHNVSEGIKYAFCNITKKAPNCYTTREVAEMMKKLLILRIHGYSYVRIAKFLHESVETIKLVEKLAVNVIKDTIQATRGNSIPIIGAN